MGELPARNSNRLKDYDYSNAGYYFVTICVKDGHEILARIVGDAHPGVPPYYTNAPLVKLTEIGKVVSQHIENIPLVYDAVAIDQYTIMPNHVHMVVVIKNKMHMLKTCGTPGCASPTKSTLAKVINALKALTSKQFGESIWQRSYHDRIIRNEEEYQQIWQYIEENPARLAGIK